jgi:hypothetical protein
MTNLRQRFRASQMHYNCTKENIHAMFGKDEKGGEHTQKEV